MIRKAVIPSAGFGTRFLPATKSQPKEMLPIVDTPTIQFVVEEAVSSGIEDILIIIGKGKRVIEDHFDNSFELENELAEKNNKELLKEIQRISNLANIHFIRQKRMNGLGAAIYYAKQHVDDEPFAVLLGDTILDSPKPCLAQLIKIFEESSKTIIGLEEVPEEKISRYGIIDGDIIKDNLYLLKDFIEKPSIKEAPSNLAIGGRYIFTPDIFEYIKKTPPGKNNEIQLTDAIKILNKDQAVYGYKFDGIRYDIGSKLDFLKTNVEFALKRDEFKDDFLAFLRDIIRQFPI